ncbi:type IV pilus biogenesis/stability protein PilW [Neisseria lisongii]|uniref:Type IV pilus biogenesis/stability protein PilW n=1 Tax=Neisseria lisongii TaxID=2912188 RepID=A0AAW5AB58_9NEIS|nr:type IV pilus biogenesis/stability protein PilW [Neisseria lisongii]MCF7528886.1 type IV pilus biogenesis/stability protein PilW [Neisseria lisongii]
MKGGKWLWAVLLLAGCAAMSGVNVSERDARMADIKTRLALAYMNAGDYRNATDNIEAAVRFDRNSSTAWLVRAQIYQYLNLNNKAQESFDRALALQPNSAEINNNYGWFVCNSLNRPEAALPHFNKALADPTYPTPHIAYLNKGICSGRMGHTAEAEQALKQALALRPDFAAAQTALLQIQTASEYGAERK